MSADYLSLSQDKLTSKYCIWVVVTPNGADFSPALRRAFPEMLTSRVSPSVLNRSGVLAFYVVLVSCG